MFNTVKAIIQEVLQRQKLEDWEEEIIVVTYGCEEKKGVTKMTIHEERKPTRTLKEEKKKSYRVGDYELGILMLEMDIFFS